MHLQRSFIHPYFQLADGFFTFSLIELTIFIKKYCKQVQGKITAQIKMEKKKKNNPGQISSWELAIR